MTRLFSALFAPWFALAVAEPVPMHDCPMHSLHPAAMHGMSGGGGASARGETGAAKANAGMERGGVPLRHETPGNPPQHQCCCLGTCCAAAIFDLARAPRVELKPVVRYRELPAATGTPIMLAADDYVLPFANGPPTAHA